jgi:hypothetical protein
VQNLFGEPLYQSSFIDALDNITENVGQNAVLLKGEGDLDGVQTLTGHMHHRLIVAGKRS